MDSKITEHSSEKKQSQQTNVLPTNMKGRTRNSNTSDEEINRVVSEFMNGNVRDMQSKADVNTHEPHDSIDTDNTNVTDKTNSTGISKDTKETESTEQTEPSEHILSTVAKRISNKKRKESLDEYREAFLQIPKIEDRKPVFLSCELRDRLDNIVRKLGGRRMSVSGFIENLVRNHLSEYKDDIEYWKKL